MIFIFHYNACSLTIHNNENTNNTTIFVQSPGRCIVGLDPIHQGRESRWIRKKLNRLGYHDTEVQNRVIKILIHGLRAKEHVCVEL